MHAVLLYCITHDLSRFTFRTKLGRLPWKETVSNEPFYIYFFFLKTLHTRVKFCWPTANLAYSLYGVFPGLLSLYISVTDHVRPETCWPRRLLRPLGLGNCKPTETVVSVFQFEYMPDLVLTFTCPENSNGWTRSIPQSNSFISKFQNNYTAKF